MNNETRYFVVNAHVGTETVLKELNEDCVARLVDKNVVSVKTYGWNDAEEKVEYLLKRNHLSEIGA